MSGPDPGSRGGGERRSGTGPTQELVELVGPHLRVSGLISFGRFGNLADLVNHNRSFLVLHDARLLDRAGGSTGLVMAELIVNQDDVTFVGHERAAAGTADDSDSRPGLAVARPDGAPDRAGPDKLVRQFVIFTPGHAITGGMHVFRDMTLANYVEATDPRFIAVSDAEARSLADPRAVSQFALLLVNRTQISAIAESDPDSQLIAAAVHAAVASPSPGGSAGLSGDSGATAGAAGQLKPVQDARRTT